MAMGVPFRLSALIAPSLSRLGPNIDGVLNYELE
jgi:hypothetical protein